MCGGTIERHFSCIFIFNYYRLLLYFTQTVIKLTSQQESNTLLYVDLCIDSNIILSSLFCYCSLPFNFRTFTENISLVGQTSCKLQNLQAENVKLYSSGVYLIVIFFISACPAPHTHTKKSARCSFVHCSKISSTLFMSFFRFKYTETRL